MLVSGYRGVNAAQKAASIKAKFDSMIDLGAADRFIFDHLSMEHPPVYCLSRVGTI